MTRTKICTSCLRDLPTHFYGPYRRSADGLNTYCLDCTRELNRRTRNRKYGISQPHRVKHSDCIFHFDTHNETILKLALMRQNTAIYGYHIETLQSYEVHFSTLDPQGLQVWVKGSPIPAVRLYGFPGEEMIPSLLKWLRNNKIRIEKDTLSQHESMTLLYQIRPQG